MKKWIVPSLLFLIIFIAACQPVQKAEPQVPKEQVPIVGAQPDLLGSGMAAVDNDEKDLSTDELEDIDSGLQDIQNI